MPRPTRRRLSALAVTALLALPVAPALAAEQRPGPERSLRGEAAVRALGDRLPVVAAAHGRSAAELRTQLLTDPTLWVDPTLRLFYVEPPAPAPQAETQAQAAPVDPSTTFRLHSEPGAQRTVYLDVDGHDFSGTAWEEGATTTVSAPYSFDADPTTLSAEDHAQIQLAWQRMAEDFAPFDVDVTTEEPPADALARSGPADTVFGSRLVVTPTDQSGCRCGGIAYVGVFDRTDDLYQPAFVYAGVGADAKFIAEAGSHEVGHNLGLSHDGTRRTAYYEGQGAWAPIMGVGYYRPVSQWSKGEYSGANQREDDFAVMATLGAPLRSDEPDTGLGSLALGATVEGGGVIASAADQDRFTVTTQVGGTLTVAVDVAPVGADLDARVRLTGAGVDLTADPPVVAVDASTATGLSTTVSASVPAGTYVVEVDGVGSGSATSTGYSDYGSVGAYSVRASLAETPPAPVVPGTPVGLSAALSGTGVQVVWADVAGETGYELAREKRAKNGTFVPAATLVLAAETTGYLDAPGAGTFRYRLRAVSAAGASPWTGYTVPVTVATGGKPR